MSQVLVTGSTGNVGIALIADLTMRSVPVKAAVRPGKVRPNTDSVAYVEFDFSDPATFAAALEGVDRVFLMRPPHMSDAQAFRPFIEAMVEAGVRQVVFLSVQGAGQNIFVPHHGIEVLLKKSGLDWTILRPSFFMQNLSTTHLADVRDRGEIVVPAGNGRTNFIDVADIAEAAAVCLTEPGHDRRAYEITGSEALTYSEVAEILSAACDRPITYLKPTAQQFKAHMKRYGHDDDFIAVMSSIYAMARFRLAAGTTDVLEKLVGHKPRTLKEWAEQNAECWTVAEAAAD